MVIYISIVQVGPYIKLINLMKNFPRNIFAETFYHPNPCFQNCICDFEYMTLKICDFECQAYDQGSFQDVSVLNLF